MKRFISAILLCAMLASLAACGEEPTDTPNTPTTNDPAVTTAAPEATHDANGFLLDTIPADTDFGGAEAKILIRTSVANTEYYVEEQTGDIIDDALHNRNKTVEERLGVTLNFIDMAGEWAERDAFNGAIRNSVLAEDGAYDLCAVLSNQLSVLTLEGLLINLNTLDYLDFDKPWWANGLLDELAVNDKLYFVSGDASLGLVKGMMCIFYNKQMSENYGIGGMYEMVSEGTWTIDKLIELAKGAYQDLDNNGKKSKEDQFGLGMGDYNQLYGFLDSFNLQIIQRDDQGYPATFVYDNERVVNAYQKLVDVFKRDNAFFVSESVGMHPAFRESRVLFCTGEFGYTDMFRDISDFDFGVLPFPKYDEAQEDYRTTARATYSSFCIPITVNDPKMSAAVLECFASESYRQVSPTYFESALKVKHSRDDESSVMFDLIKSSVTFSFATSFTTSIGDPQNLFKNTLIKFNKNWISQIAKWMPSAQILLDDALATLKELP